MVDTYGASFTGSWVYMLSDSLSGAITSSTVVPSGNYICLWARNIDLGCDSATDLKHIAAETSYTPNTGKRKYSVQLQGRIVKIASSIYDDLNTIDKVLSAWEATNAPILYLILRWTDGGSAKTKTWRNGSTAGDYALKCSLRSYKITNDGIKHFNLTISLEDRTL